ncbi:MAG TPA: hypothetical protein VK196_11935 [Magnetospirillum sp.]|nr:hypothetical protein [Magnetospirillum sp.]
MPTEVALILWLAFATVPAIVAVRRGRIFVFWYVGALLFSPLIALVAVLVMRDLRKTAEE